MDLLDEVAQHALGGVEIRDDAVLERTDRDDVAGRAADHPLRLGPDGEDARRGGVYRDHAGFVQDDSAATDVDEGVGGAKVHGHVTA